MYFFGGMNLEIRSCNDLVTKEESTGTRETPYEPADERREVIAIDVGQVGSAADEADYRADDDDDEGSQQRVVHEGYPVGEEGFVRGLDLHGIPRGRDGLIESQVRAAVRRGRQRLVAEAPIGHVPLRTHDDPDHRQHRDQSTDHRALGRRPGHQHPQREQTEQGTGSDAGHRQRQLEDVAQAVHEEHHAHAEDAQDDHCDLKDDQSALKLVSRRASN